MFLEIDNFFITHGFGLPYYQRRHNKKYASIFRVNRFCSSQHASDWEVGYEYYGVINIFGHDAFSSVKKDKNYYGIDTGCVYGNKLTAIELGSMNIISSEFEPIDCGNKTYGNPV